MQNTIVIFPLWAWPVAVLAPSRIYLAKSQAHPQFGWNKPSRSEYEVRREHCPVQVNGQISAATEVQGINAGDSHNASELVPGQTTSIAP